MGPTRLSASYDDVVIKSPNDRRSYRILHLPNGLFALLVHDPEIYSDGYPPQSESQGAGEEEDEVMEDASSGDEEEEEDDDEEEEEEDDDEELDSDEEEEEDNEGCDSGVNKRKNKEQTVKKAAAAMCVGTGSFCDPPYAQGLAHFLEHMLFMGSSEFPDENEYDSYLSKHGGSSNACTETEYTCYFFEVNRDFLNGALKRFSQFFISPLIKAEAMEREVMAVDSEFNHYLQNDNCRLQQVQSHTSTPGHLLNRFCWGNKKSLSDAEGSGINIREELLRIYRDNYHAGIMKLVVIGGEPLDTLEDWVVELFSKIKEGPQVHNNVENCPIPFWKSGKLYRLEAVKDLHTLHLSWTLPCLKKEYLKKPEDYISHLLGHEGKGSILYLLKEKGWATFLSAGVGQEGTQRSFFAYVLTTSIHLTDEGLEKMYEVIGIVYQYIKLLNQSKSQEWIFRELQNIGNMEFRFAEEQSQDEYAFSLAENTLLYQEKHIVCGEYLHEEWDPALVEYIMTLLSPDNMRIDLVTKSFDKNSQAVQLEPWFGSRYTEEDVPSSFLQTWRDPPSIDKLLHLPLKNEFIPCNFGLRNADMLKPQSHVNPVCIIDQPFVKVWYKMDFTFNMPRACTYFLISVKDGYTTLKNAVLTELFVNLLKDELNDIIYQASVAKLETSITIGGDKLELKIYGFNDKIPVLLSKIVSMSHSFSPKIDRFKVIKENMERSYRNANIKPGNHSTYLRLQVLRERFYDTDDKLATLTKLSLSDLLPFIANLLSQMYVEGLCYGNLSEKEAVKLSEIFTSTLNAKPLPDELKHHDRVVCLPLGAMLLQSVPVKNDLEVNSVVELYYQLEQERGRETSRLKSILDLLTALIDEPYFDRLRTKEQLGYTLDCGPRTTYRVMGMLFYVQSSKFGPSFLQSRIENFLEGVPEILNALDEESFKQRKDALIADKLEKEPSLTSEADIYWYQIVDKRYLFDMQKIEAEELRTIEKKDVIDLYNTYFRPQSPTCKRFAVHVQGCSVHSADDLAKMQEKSWKTIGNVESFKQTSEFYSSLC
ncbi:hypothetical protein LUZ61_003306 [Rhynchospora tenuis]|uniref:Nardilysin-like n=1 Tax=Rhynchospora tenuis TaxID=198213 RepID=A0AAD5ZKJ5_9POAL|nr:hypothetical protein LUZ61_003306 [Rhynchospora tenuis]